MRPMKKWHAVGVKGYMCIHCGYWKVQGGKDNENKW